MSQDQKLHNTNDVVTEVVPMLGEIILNKELSQIERVRKRYRAITLGRLSEYMITNLFFGLESYYDISKVPENYATLTEITRSNSPSLNLPPEILHSFNSLGDVLEVSAGFGIIRFSLAVVEEILKSEPMKLFISNAMKHDALNKLVKKTIGKEKTDELTLNGEIEMPDDAQFWTALVPWTIVKAAHSLGLISLGAHDHIGAAVPQMLIGQAFAVASLVTLHYGTKNSEEILKITRDIFSKTGGLVSDVQQHIGSSYNQLHSKVEQNMSINFDRVDMNLNALSQKMDEWTRKVSDYDPSNVIPSPEQVWKTILGKRIWNALASLGVENDKDNLE